MKKVEQPVVVKKDDAMESFEVTTGRVKVAKQVRKVRERKDSLDDHSSASDDEPVQTTRRGRQMASQADKELETKR